MHGFLPLMDFFSLSVWRKSHIFHHYSQKALKLRNGPLHFFPFYVSLLRFTQWLKALFSETLATASRLLERPSLFFFSHGSCGPFLLTNENVPSLLNSPFSLFRERNSWCDAFRPADKNETFSRKLYQELFCWDFLQIWHQRYLCKNLISVPSMQNKWPSLQCRDKGIP